MVTDVYLRGLCALLWRKLGGEGVFCCAALVLADTQLKEQILQNIAQCHYGQLQAGIAPERSPQVEKENLH